MRVSRILPMMSAPGKLAKLVTEAIAKKAGHPASVILALYCAGKSMDITVHLANLRSTLHLAQLPEAFNISLDIFPPNQIMHVF